MDLIGPYTIKAKDNTILDFMCLTMIDPATGWFEIVELPNTDVTYIKNNWTEVTDANAILERQHATIGDMLRTSGLDMRDSVDESDIDDLSSTSHAQ